MGVKFGLSHEENNIGLGFREYGPEEDTWAYEERSQSKVDVTE